MALWGQSPLAVQAIQGLSHLPVSGWIGLYLKEALCQHYSAYGFSMVITANGSNDIIDLMMKSLLMPDEKIAVWTPTFIIYKLCSWSHGRDG